MVYQINGTVTAYLPFNTPVTITVQSTGDTFYTEQVQFSDPNGLTNNFIATAQNNVILTNTIEPITTSPVGLYSNFPGYPVNVVITNDGGSGQHIWYNSYVNITSAAAYQIVITSQDTLDQNINWNSLTVVFSW